MNKKEYGSWSPFNKDNPKYSPDEYNRSFIKERFEPAGEYDGSDFDEYYQPPKITDSFNFEKKKSEEKTGKKSKSARQLRQNMIRQVVCLAAGSVVITTSYQSVIKQQQAQMQPDNNSSYTQDVSENEEPIVLSPTWKWSDDNSTVILELTDPDGKLVKEIPATVSVEDEVEATCNKEGTRIYTATIEDENNTYTDSRSATVDPLGHDFNGGEEVVLQTGHTAITFGCNRCGEEFTIETSMTEND